MKRLILLLTFTTSLFAASWDGTRGDITLTTIARADGRTTFNISCANPLATAIRIKVMVLVPPDDGSAPGWDVYATVIRTVDLEPSYFWGQRVPSFISVALPVKESLIYGSPQITALVDGDTAKF